MGRLLIVAVLALACALMSLKASAETVTAYGERFQRNFLLSGLDEDWKSSAANSRILWGGKQEVFLQWPKAEKGKNELYLSTFMASASALIKDVGNKDQKYNRAAPAIVCVNPPAKAAPTAPAALAPATPPPGVVIPPVGVTQPMPPSSATVTPPLPVTTPMATPGPAPVVTSTAVPVLPAAAPAPVIPEEEQPRCHLQVTRIRVQLENTLPDLVPAVGGSATSEPAYFEAKPFTHEFRTFVVTFQGRAAEELFEVYLAKAHNQANVRRATKPLSDNLAVISDLVTRDGSIGTSPIRCQKLTLLYGTGKTPTTYTCQTLEETFKVRRSLSASELSSHI